MKTQDRYLNNARISKINETVSSNSTLLPYALFPVRLETHFRTTKVNSRLYNDVETENILVNFNDLGNLLEINANDRIEGATIASIFNKLYELNYKITTLDLLAAEDKKTIVLLTTHLQKLLKSRSFGDYSEIINHFIEKIKNASQNIETSSSLKRDKATVFLNKLEKEYNSLQTLCKLTKTPYRSKKFYLRKDNRYETNKKLYQYLTARLKKLQNFFVEATNEFNYIRAIDNNQIKKLKAKLKGTNYNNWNTAFNEIKNNLEAIYQSELSHQETENINRLKKALNVDKLDLHIIRTLESELDHAQLKALHHQRVELIKKYNEEWKEIVDKTIPSCRKFIENSIQSIDTKVKKAYNATSILESSILLRFQLLQPKNFSYEVLRSKINKLHEKIKNEFLHYKEEQAIVLAVLNDLKKTIGIYEVNRASEKIVNYNNSPLSDFLDFKNIENSSTLKSNTQTSEKQLCVRIFPDEIFVHQHDNELTKEEWEDGRRFWMEWFIASGNKKYQKLPWNFLWHKYGVMRASWIARTLRIINLESLYDKYPYKNNDKAIKALDELINLSDIFELDPINDQKENEGKLKLYINNMLPKFYEFRKIFMQYDLIVDYLLEEAMAGLSFITKRLEVIHQFYQRYPKYKEKELASFRDEDYLALTAFYAEIKDLMTHLNHKKIGLNEMIDEYFKEDLDGSFFPTVSKLRNPDVHSAPQSTILPERFLFIGEMEYKSDKNNKKHTRLIKFSGRRVNPELQLGFNPFEAESFNIDFDSPIFEPYVLDQEFGEIEVKGAAKWMTDYETAVHEGMAISVPIPADKVSDICFKSIYVLGVKKNLNATDFEDFINSHIYGKSGMDLLKIGTATNSLDNIVSGFNSDDQLIEEERYQIDVLKNTSNIGSDALALQNALGLNKSMFEETLARMTSYANNEIGKAKKVNNELSKVFHSNFKNTKGTNPYKNKLNNFLANIPKFISNYALARGTTPSIRVGNQPYGILPTTAFSKFNFEDKADVLIQKNINKFRTNNTDKLEYDATFIQFSRELHSLLKHLNHIWTNIKKSKVLHSENLGNNPNTAHKKFIEMIGLTPVSVTFFERSMIEIPKLLQSSINYDPLHSQNINLGKILHTVLNFGKNAETVAEELKKHSGLLLNHPIQEMVEELSVENYLNKNLFKTVFKDIDEDEKVLLFAEFLDLFSHRLDAWWLGLVNYQLNRIRSGVFEAKLNESTSQKEAKISLGAFGWLFDLKEKEREKYSDSERQLIETKMNVAEKGSPIFKDKEQSEFFIAPSHNHAVTTAVLRSSYLKSKAEGDDSRMSINLSSMRVRQALNIINGVRNGLPIGAILGADLERNLHEAYKLQKVEMNRFIYPLRKLFPLKIDINSKQNESEATYLMTTINGETLLNSFWQDYEEYLENSSDDKMHLADYLMSDTAPKWFKNLFKSSETVMKETLSRVIEQMADAQDALADVVLSEGVYQLVQGNRVAFKAWMNNLEDGNFTNNPEVTEIPMNSAMIQHKVAYMLQSDVYDYSQVIDLENNPMKITEPNTNQWIEKQTGPMSNIQFGVEITTESEKTDRFISLDDLEIAPIEYLFLSNNLDLFKRFLEYQIRHKYGYLQEHLSIDFGMKNYEESNKISIKEHEFLLNQMRSLLSSVRPLNAKDFSFTPQEEDRITENYDLKDLKKRFETLFEFIRNLNDELFIQLNSLKNNPNPLTSNEIHKITGLLLKSFRIGISSSLSGLPTMFFNRIISEEQQLENDLVLIQTLESTFNIVHQKVEKATAFLQLLDKEKTLLFPDFEAAFQDALQNDFKISARFKLDSIPEEDWTMLQHQLQTDFSYKNAQALDLEEWLAEIAKVRASMGNLHRTRMASEWAGMKQSSLKTLQFPFTTKDHFWLGREVPNEDYVDDKDSLIMLNAPTSYTNPELYMCGFVIDQWMELIPYRQQQGGMVFNYDQPNAEAPQVILLALPATIRLKSRKSKNVEAKNWHLDELISILNDTKEMAENRAVEPDHIYDNHALSKVLPLLKI